MLSQEQIKKLSILDTYIEYCIKCKEFKNGIAIPYWSKKSKYAMIAEAPGREEIDPDKKTPLIGASGKLLFKILRKLGLYRHNFLLINTMQCRPLNKHKGNGKPTKENINNCDFWVKKYLEVFDPKGIITLGNFATEKILGKSGIMNISGNVYKRNGKIIVPCIHPASACYDRKHNKPILEKSLKSFIELINSGSI
jgi:uracil-DNA glycosylase family 4